MGLKAMLVLMLLRLGAGEHHCAADGATCKVNDMSLLQVGQKFQRQGADSHDQEGEATQQVESECTPESTDPKCKKIVKVKIPEFEIPIPCCKGCPCGSTTMPPLTIVKNSLPPEKVGVCSWHGDPHFKTFDGQKIDSKRTGTFWFVHSPNGVQIQGRWGKAGMTIGMAFGGEWMKGHTLIVNPKFAKIDGKKILEKAGTQHSIPGVCELHHYGAGALKLSEEQLKELDGSVGEYWKKHYKDFTKRRIMVLKLPGFVEIWISSDNVWAGVQHMNVLLKMPPQPDQGGYCGNFNGEAKDDKKDNMKEPIPADDDLFEKDGKWMAIVQEDTDEQSTEKKKECPADLLKKAKEACSHIPEEAIKKDCIFDICVLEDVGAAQEAIDFEALRLVAGKGMIEFEGQGRCLDQAKKEFSTIKADGVDNMKQCLSLMAEASDKKLLDVLRGAQFKDHTTDGGGSCYLLLEAGAQTNELTPKLPGLWGSPKSKDGSGIVSSTDSDQGFYCWNFLN